MYVNRLGLCMCVCGGGGGRICVGAGIVVGVGVGVGGGREKVAGKYKSQPGKAVFGSPSVCLH